MPNDGSLVRWLQQGLTGDHPDPAAMDMISALRMLLAASCPPMDEVEWRAATMGQEWFALRSDLGSPMPLFKNGAML